MLPLLTKWGLYPGMSGTAPWYWNVTVGHDPKDSTSVNQAVPD